MARFLILGGGGRLAGAIVSHLLDTHLHTGYYPPRHVCDITHPKDLEAAILDLKPDIVINCAGILPPETERNRYLAREVNIIGAMHVAIACRDHGIRLIHISSDAVFSGRVPHEPYEEGSGLGIPMNEYSFTKQVAETTIRFLLPSALILRAPFRHRGLWPHTHAFTDAYRSSRWVDEVAPEIVQAALIRDLSGVLHTGGPRRSVFEMAKEASPDVQPYLLKDFKDFRVPRDLTLDSSKWERIKKERGL